jgi:hypothetical protein
VGLEHNEADNRYGRISDTVSIPRELVASYISNKFVTTGVVHVQPELAHLVETVPMIEKRAFNILVEALLCIEAGIREDKDSSDIAAKALRRAGQ